MRHTLVVGLLAPWCGPRRIIGPIPDDLAKEPAGRVVVAKPNVDENPTVPGHRQVTGMPTQLVFENGKPIDRNVGALPKEALKSRMAAY